MKKMLLALALLVIVTPVALAEDAANTDALDAEAPSMEVVETAEQATEVVLDSDGLPLSAVEVAIKSATTGYECPPYTTYCWRDSQCDAPCGGPGTGACQNGCCYCAL